MVVAEITKECARADVFFDLPSNRHATLGQESLPAQHLPVECDTLRPSAPAVIFPAHGGETNSLILSAR